MFPPNANGSAQGVASFFNWVADISVYLLFPIIFTIIILVSLLLMVETKNTSPNKVIAEYEKKSFMLRMFFRRK
ncbi:hypothetical protein MXB_250 [Myxobolus squamalis]|nr:hypothetical protein MXB_250 [Myxobolus squamalis]